MTKQNQTTRRDFIKRVGAGAVAVAGTVAAGESSWGARQLPAMAKGRVIGANDRINVGFVGCGGRMNTHIRRVMERNKERGDVQAVAVNESGTNARPAPARRPAWMKNPFTTTIARCARGRTSMSWSSRHRITGTTCTRWRRCATGRTSTSKSR